MRTKQETEARTQIYCWWCSDDTRKVFHSVKQSAERRAEETRNEDDTR
jgi:hypothetical protein